MDLDIEEVLRQKADGKGFLKGVDEKILNRLLAYNEDDCKATMVLKQALEKLSP